MKTKQTITQKDHYIWHWKSMSWHGTGKECVGGYTVCTIKSCIESGSSRNNMVIKCYNQNLM